MSRRLLSLEDEIEGDCQGTTDFVFCRIGEPVRLLPTLSNSVFDLSCPPVQPLAVSERHRLLFLAYSEGFLVANTKDVIELAKGTKEKVRDPCIQKSCVVDVHIGRVSILSLSGDSSILAVIVGSDIHLFPVESLLGKVKEPAISAPLSKSAMVKDFKWRRNSENSFIVLSSHGSLCHGYSSLQLKDVLDNVDAVDWSPDGNLVAIARKDTVSILTSDFEEILAMPLLYQSWTVDCKSERKVDSIKWVRHDSIVIGCTQLTEDSEDDRYIVQVIASGEHSFTEVSCKPLVFSFPDLFEGLSVDMLPAGVGPYLLSEYLECWDVAFTSNKRNVDQHISLLKWVVEGNQYEVVSLELGSDKYIPRIDLQDGGDDNFVLGLAVDKVSLYDKIKIQRDLELKELSPRCILLCLTCDGKLTLYHTAWVSEPSALLKVASSHGDNIEEPNMCSKAGDLGTNSTINEMASESLAVKGSDTDKTIGFNFNVGPSFEPQIDQKPSGVNGSNPIASSTTKETVISKSLASTIFFQECLSRSQTSKAFGVDASKSKLLLSSTGESNLSRMVNEEIASPLSNSPAEVPTCSQPFGPLALQEKASQSGLPAYIKSGHDGSSSILHSSSIAASAKLPASKHQLSHANSTSTKPRQTLEYEHQFSKQFYNVKDLTKELDALLSSIEREGGFKDQCSVFQEQSLLALEAGLDDLSEVLYVNRNKVENELAEIQLLRNKMLEVSARQVVMECIVQQASNNRYWDVWNTQKLSPEYEAKRQRISNLKQNLTNQLIELERHFISLEINRFGEYNAAPTGRRALCGSSSPSRPTQSLHSVYRTVNLQVAAAEQLSECLSKQMEVLSITSCTPEKRKFTKELFESIGLDPKMDSFKSPDPNSSKFVPYSAHRNSLSTSTALKEHSRKSVPTSLKSFESARRKRDSLDKGWAHFQPSRTTIKRTSKNERVRSNLDITFKEAKGVFDSEVKAFEIAQTGMSDFYRASSKPFGITKRTSSSATSSMSRTTSSYSQSFELSPSKGVQEKSSKKAIDGQSKPLFKWAKDHSDLSSEPNTISGSHSSQVFQSATAQPSLIATPAIPSSYNNEKSGSPFMFNMVTSSANQSSSAATKTALKSKSTTHQKFSDSVSPAKIEYAAEKRSQLYQESSLKHEVDILANPTHSSSKNSVIPSTALSTSIEQSSASLSSSSFPSFQFGEQILPGNLLSPNTSNAPPPFSTELNLKSVSFPATVHSPEGSRSSNEVASELERAISQSTKNQASTKELNSELKTDTLQASITLQIPATSIAPPSPCTVTNELVFTDVSNSQPKADSVGTMSSSIMTTEKDEHLDGDLFQEDEMEEEVVDTSTVLNLETLGGFSLQSTPSSNVMKPNPFGSSFVPPSTGSTSPLVSWNTSPGQLFRPSSFNLPESKPSQTADSSSLTGIPSGSGFGQPAQLGAGQQALGSVLGSFGQSRQIGAGVPGLGFASSGIPAAASSGGSVTAGGFAGAAKGGGFAGLAPNTGGFAGLATNTGGFTGVATNTGGFAGAATFSGGFAGAASAGGGFGGASSGNGFSSGGFGGFGNTQGGGFSGFGTGRSVAGRPPAELLTQMRK